MKKFEVLVARIGYSFANLTVEAETEELAKQQAIELAYSHSFSNESGSEYEIEECNEVKEI